MRIPIISAEAVPALLSKCIVDKSRQSTEGARTGTCPALSSGNAVVRTKLGRRVGKTKRERRENVGNGGKRNCITTQGGTYKDKSTQKNSSSPLSICLQPPGRQSENGDITLTTICNPGSGRHTAGDNTTRLAAEPHSHCLDCSMVRC